MCSACCVSQVSDAFTYSMKHHRREPCGTLGFPFQLFSIAFDPDMFTYALDKV